MKLPIRISDYSELQHFLSHGDLSERVEVFGIANLYQESFGNFPILDVDDAPHPTILIEFSEDNFGAVLPGTQVIIEGDLRYRTSPVGSSLVLEDAYLAGAGTEGYIP